MRKDGHLKFSGFSPRAFELMLAAADDPPFSVLDARREEQERFVREPMIALCRELEPEFGPAKVYNLHRDPIYWKQQVAVLGSKRDAGYVIVLSFDGLVLRAGWFKSRPCHLIPFRDAIADEESGERLSLALERCERDGWLVEGDRYARVPKPFDPGHIRADLLRCRRLMASLDCGDPSWLETAEAVPQVTKRLRQVKPLVSWFEGALPDRQAPGTAL